MSLEEKLGKEKTAGTSKIKNFSYLALLFFASLFVALLIAEGLLRLVYNPIDYLKPILIANEMVGWRIQPHSAAHDAWGFRNPTVPAHADIVTFGDSQTYGEAADHRRSWPAFLQQISGKSVYNLALSGYGLAQYRYLLENYALKLHPQQAIVGLYFGNDFQDAYRIVYGYDFWKELRTPGFDAEPDLHSKAAELINANAPRRFTRLQNWLRSHSMFYRFLSIPFENMKAASIKRVMKNQEILDPKYTIINDDLINVHTGFKPLFRLSNCNINDARIQEGLRLGLILIDQMNLLCQQQGVEFSLVLIPTKELVFSKYFENCQNLKNAATIADILASERLLRQKVIELCAKRKIPFADPLEAMQQAIGKEMIYPDNLDDHPNGNGYRIIAESFQNSLMNAP